MSGVTWKMSRDLSELMQRHGVTLVAPCAVALSEPTSGPVVLSGFASTLDLDAERVQFAARAFGDVVNQNVPLHFDHQGIVAGRIECLGYTERGELTVQVYAAHEMARRCNAFSVAVDIENFSLHDVDNRNFFARIERCRLREISLVPHPVNARALVTRREPPSPLSKFAASTLRQYDLSIRYIELIRKQVEILQEAYT